MSTVVPLPEFLATHEIGRLSVADRRVIVQQALTTLEQGYALLGFKVARYGVNPLQRLRRLADRLDRPGPPDPEWRFHGELVDIFNSLHDLHTRYALPRPFTTMVAYLPFLLKEFTEGGRRRYLVGNRTGATPVDHPRFVPDVEITHWNGTPIARAVERFAERFPGANPEARHARGVDRFTFRSLAFGPPPDEDWITVHFVDLDGQLQSLRTSWSVAPVLPGMVAGGTGDAPLGVDVEGALLAGARTRVFAPEFLAAVESGRAVDAGPHGVRVTPEWSTTFEARRVTAGGREFGYLRIRTFMPTQSPGPGFDGERWIEGFVGEFIRLLGDLPPDGLVVDIRGNGGGFIAAAELALQALTAATVEPEPAQLAATALTLRICRTRPEFAPWLASTEQALESGATHSAGVPLTPPALLARVPQAYAGPVVLLTDARCYSAADIFAAGFQDNGIGDVLGTDTNIGAGGGNVWQMSRTVPAELLTSPAFPFDPLPGGADLTFVIRRMLRVGPNAGTPLEDYGLVPDAHHAITRNDLRHGETDLMTTAALLLGKGRPRRFDVTVAGRAGDLTLSFATLGVDRADVRVDGRPRLTVDADGEPGPVPLTLPATPALIEVLGYDGGALVARRTFVTDGDGVPQPRTTFSL